MRNELHKSIVVLKNQGVILYPTDTVWGIGCDAMDKEAVSKIFEIKKRDESKSLVVLVASIEMLKKYIKIMPDTVETILKQSLKPTTIIYNNPKGFANNAIAKDNTVAIRIVQDEFCRKLIEEFGRPIISTSANISDNPTPKHFKEISQSIMDAVDYVVNLRQNEITNSPSKIIKITPKGELQVIRD